MFNEEAHRAAGDGDAPARYEESVTKQEEPQCALHDRDKNGGLRSVEDRRVRGDADAKFCLLHSLVILTGLTMRSKTTMMTPHK